VFPLLSRFSGAFPRGEILPQADEVWFILAFFKSAELLSSLGHRSAAPRTGGPHCRRFCWLRHGRWT
jgi:hypothetical protein